MVLLEELLVPDTLASHPFLKGGYSLPLLGNQSFFRPIPESLTQVNRHLLAKALEISPHQFVSPRLAHGKRILEVKKKDMGRGALSGCDAPSQVDGLITKERGVFLLTTAADCLPILAFSEPELICASVHCGRRGLELGILEEMVAAFERLGAPPSHLRVILGPCIRVCCYEVDYQVARSFQEKFGTEGVRRQGNRFFLDLAGTARRVLQKLGVKHIEEVKECTYCHPRGYFSYRKDGDWFQTLAAVIGVKE